jgi:hypothetical protein
VRLDLEVPAELLDLGLEGGLIDVRPQGQHVEVVQLPEGPVVGDEAGVVIGGDELGAVGAAAVDDDDFIGDRATWTADRVRRADAAWRLMQGSVTGASPVRFGLTARPGGPEALSAVVSFVGRPRPYAARIVMRDPSLAARPGRTACWPGWRRWPAIRPMWCWCTTPRGPSCPKR